MKFASKQVDGNLTSCGSHLDVDDGAINKGGWHLLAASAGPWASSCQSENHSLPEWQPERWMGYQSSQSLNRDRKRQKNKSWDHKIKIKNRPIFIWYKVNGGLHIVFHSYIIDKIIVNLSTTVNIPQHCSVLKWSDGWNWLIINNSTGCKANHRVVLHKHTYSNTLSFL